MIYLILLWFASLFSIENDRLQSCFFSPGVESLEISNWQEPSFEDYLLIQNSLHARALQIQTIPFSMPFIPQNLFGSISYRMGRLTLIDETQPMPSFHIEHLGNDPEKKDKCVICYVGYESPGSNREYLRGLRQIKKSLEKFHFDGHFIYRIGGWPNLKNNRLKWADVPYAFKPFFFEEVRDLGYKQILWLDAASVPIKSLDPIFNHIQKNGCCFFASGIVLVGDALSRRDYVTRQLGIKRQNHFKEILSQVVGFDMDNQQGVALLNRWIEAAEQKVPFLESDQLPFGFLVYQLGLLKGELPGKFNIEGSHFNFSHPHWNPEAIIYHHYDFLDTEVVVPDNLF